MRQESCWRHVWSAVSYTACLWIFLSPQAYAQEAKTKIRISYPNASIASLALFAAQQWKIFEQNGLDVESTQMRSQAAKYTTWPGWAQTRSLPLYGDCRRRLFGSLRNSSYTSSLRGPSLNR